MSFEKLLAASIVLYALLNFVILPRLTRIWNGSRTVSKVSKAGLLSAVQFVRNAALTASVMYLAFGTVTLVLGFEFGRNATALEWVVGSASKLHETLEAFQDHWSDWFFLLPLVLIIYLQWTTQQKRFSRHFESFIDNELDRLNEDRVRKPEQWANLAADERMRLLDEEIAKAESRVVTLAQHGSKDRAERRRLRRLISNLREQRTEQDYQRRVNMDATDVPEDFSLRPAWQRILLSEGLFSDLQGFSKALSRVTLAVLSLALVGVAGSAGLTEDVWNRLARLDDLRVEARTEAAEESWKEHLRKAKETTLSDEDRRAIQHLANDFARALTRNPNWESLRREIRTSGEFTRRVGRRAILEEVRLPGANGTSREAFASGLSDGEREVLHAIVSGKPHESYVGPIVADRQGAAIKSWFGAKWDGVRDAINEHAKTYHEPVSINDLQGELMDRVVSAAFDATGSSDTSDVVKAARDGMSEATKEAVRTCVESEMHRVVEDLDKGTPYAEAIEKVRTKDIPISKGQVEKLGVLIHDRNLPDERAFRDRMAANSGTWKGPDGEGPRPGPGKGPDTNGPRPPQPRDPKSPSERMAAQAANVQAEQAERNQIVNEIASKATADGKYSLREEAVGALAEYEDHFPRSVASQEATALGQTLARFRVAEDAAEFTRMAELSVERAGSFSMLRGFSKVGGVLIGRDPEGNADIRDLEWNIDGGGVTIGLRDASGTESKIGPFEKSLVHQSLAYAADGRPVAVTMTIARPVQGLKIFLHPSLVDTPLGCRVEELDRLVDTFAGSSQQLPERRALTEGYYEQVAVYNVALGKRTEAIAEKAQSLSKMATAILAESEPIAASGLHRSDLFGEDSLFRRKPEFFDASLVKTAKSCQRPDLGAFENCVLETYRSSRTLREFKEDELRRWVIDPTEFQPWSGVRERAYRIDNSLSFLRAPAGSSVEDRLWPFDFMVQVAFTSAAINLPDKEQEKYVDRQPVEFDRIQGKIEALVNRGIDDQGLRSQFEDLRKFAILQRLFRAALAGNLGGRFPTLKLAQLAKETAGAAPYFHTKRWNTSLVAALEVAVRRGESLRAGLQPWMSQAATRLPACDAALRRTLITASDSGAAKACQFADFSEPAQKACPEGADPNSAGCVWDSIAGFSGELAQIQSDEIAFGVLDDERQNPGADCPPLAFVTTSEVIKR